MVKKSLRQFTLMATATVTLLLGLIQVRWNKPGSERGLFKTSPTLEIQFRELGRAVKHLTGARGQV